MSPKYVIKPLLVAFLLLFPVLSKAQDAALLNKFYQGVLDSCLDVSYTYSTRISGINHTGEGTLLSQGMMWKLDGNGVQMYCDSQSVWIIDTQMKEVVIEPAPEDERAQWMSNPAVIFSRLSALFNVNESLSSSDGKAVIYILKPKEDSDIDFCNIELLKSDASIRNASVALSDGTLIKIEVSSMKLTPKTSIEAFRPHMSFDSSWIVTDLR